MKFYYFNSTHWDREWYQPYQEFRKYLIDTTRELLTIFETVPEYSKFTFDGQTVVLEDIVEIRPDWRPKLESLIREGKLNVGPWYVMPDEFLVSGEALVRNLLTGRRVAAEFGGTAWPVGYVCDIFGHIAQLPQIFIRFGFEGAVVWRGTQGRGGSHYIWWQSPDGSRIRTLNLSKCNGYADFSLHVRGFWNLPLDEDVFKARFRKYIEEDRDHWNGVFVLSDAFDHAYPTPDTPKMLRWIKELYPESEVIHTDYRELFADEYGNAELPVICGEQIYPADSPDNGGWQISSTLSSRCDIKRANDLCQNELELLIEPELAMRACHGDVESLPLLRYQWKHLLKNHAHDSICGCSIDQVHRMMNCRFEEVRNVGRTLDEEFRFGDRARLTGRKALEEVRNLITEDKEPEAVAKDGRYLLRVFNPLPFRQSRTVELTLEFPACSPYPKQQAEPFGYEFLNSFRLYDAQGREVDYQLKAVRRNQIRSFYRQDTRRYDLYAVVFTPELTAAGWSSFELRPSETPVRHFRTMITAPGRASNGIIELAIGCDGTLTLNDLRSNRSYTGLNDFRIDREIGDGWNHARPVCGRRVAASSSAQLAVIADGPERAEFEIVRRYELPRELRFEGTIQERYAGISESAEHAVLEIVTTVALDRGSDRIECRTVVKNNIRDYRLQLLLPTGIPGPYFASQAFTLLERSPGRSRVSESYPESEVIEKNFDGIIGKRDSRGGIAFLNRAGVHEAGALEDEGHSLVVTLLRAFRRTVQTNGETEGQLPGELAYDYAYTLFEDGCSAAGLFRQLQELRAPLGHYLLKREAVREVPAPEEFLTLSGELVYSSLKPADDHAPGVVFLRVFNPVGTAAAGVVTMAHKPMRVVKCRLDESEENVLSCSGKRLEISAGPGEIITLKLEFCAK